MSAVITSRNITSPKLPGGCLLLIKMNSVEYLFAVSRSCLHLMNRHNSLFKMETIGQFYNYLDKKVCLFLSWYRYDFFFRIFKSIIYHITWTCWCVRKVRDTVDVNLSLMLLHIFLKFFLFTHWCTIYNLKPLEINILWRDVEIE